MEIRNKLLSSISGKVWGAAGLVIVLALLVGLFLWQNSPTKIDNSTYQMVTLTSGEVYIGKLGSPTGDYVKLKNVYYQQKSSDVDSVTVVGLSSSIAKPQNTMYISGDKIVHWENLERDSKIVQAIDQDGDNN